MKAESTGTGETGRIKEEISAQRKLNYGLIETRATIRNRLDQSRLVWKDTIHVSFRWTGTRRPRFRSVINQG